MLHRIIARVACPVVTLWVRSRRNRYRAIGRALNEHELNTLGPHFSEGVLRSVRIARIEAIENPRVVRALSPLGFVPPMDLRRLRGMAFIDVVVLASGSDPERSCSVLFHELVHVAQYRELGVRRFLSRYIEEWLASGRDYWSIPSELEAFELQRRFNAGDQRIGVEEMVRRRLAPRSAIAPRLLTPPAKS